MNCNNCEHFISPDACAWGKNPKACGRNFPTLDDFYEYDAHVHHCFECKLFTKHGGHGSTDYGSCPHMRYIVFDDNWACEHFVPERVTCYDCCYCEGDDCVVTGLPTSLPQKICKDFFYEK